MNEVSTKKRTLREAHCRRAAEEIARVRAAISEVESNKLKHLNITPTQLEALETLSQAQRPLCRNEVAQGLGAKTPDTTRLLDRLERTGLISRMRDEKDRRIVRTQITTKGKEVLERGRQEVENAKEEIFRSLKTAEIHQLTVFLKAISDKSNKTKSNSPIKPKEND